MSKPVVCSKCGQNDLFWRKSVKGNWYLVEPDYVQFGERQNKLIPFAHKCKGVSSVSVKVESPRVVQLRQKLAMFNYPSNFGANADLVAVEALRVKYQMELDELLSKDQD